MRILIYYHKAIMLAAYSTFLNKFSLVKGTVYRASFYLLFLVTLFVIYKYANFNLRQILEFSFVDIVVISALSVLLLAQNAVMLKMMMGAFNSIIDFKEAFHIGQFYGLLNYLPLKAGIVGEASHLKAKYDFPVNKFIYGIAVVYGLNVAAGAVIAFLFFLFSGQADSGLLFPIFLLFLLAVIIAIFRFRFRIFRALGGNHFILKINWKYILGIAAFSVATILFVSSRNYFILDALGRDVTFGLAIMLGVASSVSFILSVTPGGIGIREALMGGVTYFANGDAAAGAALSLIARVFDIFWLTIFGSYSFLNLFGGKTATLKLSRKIFDFYIIRKANHEDVYYNRVTKEKYSPELVKQKLRALDYKKPNGPLKILKVYKHTNWEDYNLLPELKHFGEVIEYPMQDINPHSLRWQFFKKARFNRQFIKDVKNLAAANKINLIFFYSSGLMFTPGTLKEIYGLKIPTINLSLDDYLKFKGYPILSGWSGNKDICRYFTLSVTTDKSACEKYLFEGGRPLYLPPAGNEKIFKPIKTEARDIDVCFIGRNYGNRESVIEYIKKQGINIEIYGSGWPNGSVSLEKLIELYSRSKIAIGFAGSWGASKKLLAGRDFEVPLLGPLYITEYSDEMKNFWNENDEMIFYKNNDDLVQKIKYYLDNEAERTRIAENGRQRALRDHTWEKRFEYIFKFLGII